MDKTNNGFVQFLLNFANKFAAQKHIAAIRDGFITLMPATIIASFWVLVNNLLLSPTNGLFKNVPWLVSLSAIGNQVYNASLGILAILIAFTVGAALAKSYGEDKITSGFVGVISFFTLLPAVVETTSTTGKSVSIAAAYTQSQTSATGMFLAMIASLIGVTLLHKFNSYDKLKIKMPDSVPPAIAQSFNVLIPAFLVTLCLAIVEFVAQTAMSMSVPDLITKFFQAPLIGSFQTLGGILIYVCLSNLLWAFGLHGTFILGSIGEPVLLTALQQNMDALKAGKDLPNIVTKPFIDAFGWMGGGGMLICLVIAILIGSKREDYRSITKVGVLPSLFNVSEPLMFGLPVVFNPLLGIPLVVTPFVTISIGYIATSLGIINKTSVLVPWTTPPVISGYLATNGDIRASILQAVLIVIGTLIYLPFVKMTNREKL
jgi:PTS system cellobiose-specific IIC component